MRHYATGLLAVACILAAACGDNQPEQEQETTMAHPAAASLPAPAAPPPAAQPPKAEPPKAPPQQVLRLDGLRDGDQGMMPGTFSSGEGVGVVFAPGPDMYPFRVVAVQVLLAGEVGGLEVAVHRAAAGEAAPGERYAAAVAGRTGAGVARVDFEGGPVVVRSGAVMVTAALPKGAAQAPAFVVDPAVSAPNHTMAYVSAAQGAAPTWHRSVALGVRGAWAVRLIVERAE